MAHGFSTRAIHAGGRPLPAERSLATPIWQTSTFAFDDAEHYAHTLRQPREGFVYTRYENPTTAVLEATVADLEGAAEGLATTWSPSGTSTAGPSRCWPTWRPGSGSTSPSSTPPTPMPPAPRCGRAPGRCTPRPSPTRP